MKEFEKWSIALEYHYEKFKNDDSMYSLLEEKRIISNKPTKLNEEERIRLSFINEYIQDNLKISTFSDLYKILINEYGFSKEDILNKLNFNDETFSSKELLNLNDDHNLDRFIEKINYELEDLNNESLTLDFN